MCLLKLKDLEPDDCKMKENERPRRGQVQGGISAGVTGDKKGKICCKNADIGTMSPVEYLATG